MAVQFDQKKVKDFVQKNLILVLSYVVVIGCGVGAYFVNQAAEVRIAGLRNKLRQNEADLKRLSQETVPAELPTQQLLAYFEKKKQSFAEQDDQIREIYIKADKPLEWWFSEEGKNDNARFATDYGSERAQLVEDHKAILPAELPPALQRKEINRDTPTAQLMKRYNVMKRLLAACKGTVQRVERISFDDTGVKVGAGEEKKPAPGAAPDAEPEIVVKQLPVALTLRMQFPQVPILIRNILASDIPFKLNYVEVKKSEFTVDELYAQLAPEERPDLEKLKFHPVPNEKQRRAYYDDLTYTIEIDEADWDEKLAQKYLPEPPVILTLTVSALDFDVKEEPAAAAAPSTPEAPK